MTPTTSLQRRDAFVPVPPSTLRGAARWGSGSLTRSERAGDSRGYPARGGLEYGDGCWVTPSCSIALDELVWRVSRSGGPGGQHANTSETRVEVTFDVADVRSLGPRQRARLPGSPRAGRSCRVGRLPISGPQSRAGAGAVAATAGRGFARRSPTASDEGEPVGSRGSIGGEAPPVGREARLGRRSTTTDARIGRRRGESCHL